jgi:hypothetical protein
LSWRQKVIRGLDDDDRLGHSQRRVQTPKTRTQNDVSEVFYSHKVPFSLQVATLKFNSYLPFLTLADRSTSNRAMICLVLTQT